jgi:Xaa-Pro aminopeptidase
MTGRLPVVVPRLARAREAFSALQTDTLVVSHLPNIRYLTGFNGTAGLLVLTQTLCTLVVDFRYRTAARELIARDQLSEHITLNVPTETYEDALVALLHDIGAHRIGVEAASMSVSRFNKLSRKLADKAPTPLRSHGGVPVLVPTEGVIERRRAVKDADEIATLREAGRRICQAAPEAVKYVRPGRSELEVSSDVDALIRRAGFERVAFETIVASGPNSALPHARPGSRILQDGDGVVLDFGGVYDGYCVDLTRTVQLGDTGERFRQLFAAVAEAQRAAIASIRPGVKGSEVDHAARHALSRYGLEEFFGHGTGHGLGLEVHEEPRIGKRITGLPDHELEPGMIFTIEPGVYVEGVGGVRIEDDVLVTASGCEILTSVSE